MLRKNNKGEYIIDSLEKLQEWYKLTNEKKPAEKSKVKDTKKNQDNSKTK